jgi:hypothetical protein
MKDFIEKILSNKQVTIEELNRFILDYSELCGVKNTTPEQLQMAVQFIQAGMFDLNFAVKNCANKLGIQIVELWDTKTNRLLNTKIQE